MDILTSVENKVKKTIDKYRLFSQEEKILVALSGGKDSSVLAHLLRNLGYDFSCLHIDLGIGKFSELSKKCVRRQTKELGCKLQILSVEKLLRRTMDDLDMSRPICSICGITKRYLLNYYASRSGYDVVATGHNLDDIGGFYLNNLLHSQFNYLSTLKPKIPKEGEIVKKVKPLFFVRETLIRKYASLSGIEVVPVECPHKRYATLQKYKFLLEIMEKFEKNSIHNFVLNLAKNFPYKQPERNSCKVCGMPTTSERCSFCRIWNLNKKIIL